MNADPSSRFPVHSVPGGLEIVEARNDGVVCFALAGEVDIGTAPQIPVQIREALRHGAHKVCIDLSAVSFIDSTGLAALLNCQRSVARANGRLTLVHSGGEVERLFGLSRLDLALELHTSRDAALAALDGRGDGEGPAA